MKNYNEIESELAFIISEVTGNSFDNIAEKNFYEDMGFDSVSIIELLVSIEERYDINLGNDLMDSLYSCDKLIHLIMEKANN